MTDRTILRGSTEYLEVTVTADVTLDAQAVAVSFDRENWITAAWIGSPGLERTARILASDSNLPDKGGAVYVKVTDGSETPVILADGKVKRA